MTGKSPLRVMHVIGRMMGGGVESTVLNYYRHMDHSKVQFDFVITENSSVVPRAQIEAAGGRIFVVPPYSHLPAFLNSCERLFRAEHPTIVHSNLNSLNVFPLMAAKRAGVPVRIAHSHSTASPSEGPRYLIKELLRHTSHLFPTNLAACSNHAASWLFGKQSVKEHKVKILRNAIDLETFSFDASARNVTREAYGIEPSTTVIGNVGRISKQKNQRFLLNAFAMYHRYQQNSVLMLCGGEDGEADLHALAQNYGLSDSVIFTGFQKNTAPFLSAMDIFAFPSIYEGLGIALVEAQATGLPCVISPAVPREAILTSRPCTNRNLDSADQAGSTKVRIASISHKSDSVKQWARQFEALSHNDRREPVNREAFARCGYDIRDASLDLTQWYLQLANNFHSAGRESKSRTERGGAR